MCGIVGKISFGAPDIAERDIRAMSATIAHRGPDDSGCYISRDRKVGLGHQRLAIVDLSARGHQPMRYLDRYEIVFNGEIYNFEEERRALIRAGYSFQSTTDTEVILALYDKYGVACLERLRGMFSFALFDEKTGVLFCARDRLGKKPFKYYSDTDIFMFGSELKAILSQREYVRQPDLLAIHHYLTYQYCPAPFTGFAGIHKLDPAHYLLVNTRTGVITKQKYWQLSFKKKTQAGEQELSKMILDGLEEATKLRMIADVPLGAFLSGGVDSSAVVAMMAKNSMRPVKTFSIGFKEKKYNELPYAAMVAQRFQTDHTEFTVEPNALESLPTLVRHYEEPYADSSAIPTYYLSKLTRQHVTVALNGDGGDENFAGYSRYNIQKLAHAMAWLMPLAPLGKTAARNLGQIFPTTFWHRAERFWATFSEEYRRRYMNYICYFTDAMKADLYSQELLMSQLASSSEVIMNAFEEAGGGDIIDQTLYADIRTYLPEDLLVKVDIATMANSLEGRSPLLDHVFMEMVATIPSSLKLKGFTDNKYIFKKALAGLLPPEILQRKKMGFVVPIEAWFRGDMQSYVTSILLSPHTRITRRLFKKEAVARLLATHTRTRINMAPQLWALLMLELWFREFFPDYE
jgi:asparagine synthase (glutamine-hydrolysing)